MIKVRPLSERFLEQMERVVKTDGCWLWAGRVNHYGYGLIWATKTDKRRSISAHRVSWELVNGTIPGDLFVLHKCDNRLCVNPDHLFLGTNSDNMKDKMAKGREARGERHGNAKLTAEDVRSIRHLYNAEHRPQEELAAFFGVHSGHIRKIISGKVWPQDKMASLRTSETTGEGE